MQVAFRILALFSALLTASPAQAVDGRNSIAPTAESKPVTDETTWLSSFARQLRACDDRSSFFARIDTAIARGELAHLVSELPVEISRAALREAARDIADDGTSSRVTRLFGEPLAARLLASLGAIQRSLRSQLAASPPSASEGDFPDDLARTAAAELAQMARAIGSREFDESERLAHLFTARWLLSILALYEVEEPLSAEVATSIVQLFEVVAATCENPRAAVEKGTSNNLLPGPPSIGWLLLHTEVLDPHVVDLVARRPGFVEVIAAARQQLQRHFDSGTHYSLASAVDPESGDAYVVLTAHGHEPLRTAYERLEQFDEAWWLNEAERWGGQLVFQAERA